MKMERPQSSLRWLGIAIAVSLPTLVTWAYFHLLADSPASLQKGTYSVGKVIQFAFPVAWVVFVLRTSLSSAGIPSRTERASDSAAEADSTAAGNPSDVELKPPQSLSFAILMGLAVSGLMFAIYRYAFPAEVLANLQTELVDRVTGFSVDSWQKFLGLSVFYALVHSLLEEYYFRWFVFGQLRHVTRLGPAILISGLAFMGHHVIVLGHYFGGLSPITLFLSFSIAIGGMIWAWQYEKSKSLIGPWISHLLVDAGIFAIGYAVLREGGAF